MNELTLRERVAQLEAQIEVETKKLDKITKQLADQNEIILKMSGIIEKMYPIVMEVITVKAYGSFTWKSLKWIGGITVTTIISWHLFKDLIKDWLIYIFK